MSETDSENLESYITINENNILELIGSNKTLELICTHWNNLRKTVHITNNNNEMIEKYTKCIKDLENRIGHQRLELQNAIDKEVLEVSNRYQRRIHELEKQIIQRDASHEEQIKSQRLNYEDMIQTIKDIHTKSATNVTIIEHTNKSTPLVLGNNFEEEIVNELKTHFSSGYTITHDGSKHNGDIQIKHLENHLKVCIEVKNYTNIIPTKEKIKFIADVRNPENRFCAGIFISKTVGLSNTGYVEYHGDKPCFYISEGNIPFLISSVNFLFTTLSKLKTDTKTVELKEQIKQFKNYYNKQRKCLEKMGKTIKVLTKEYNEMIVDLC
jgi:hypothetical protein